MLLTFIFFFPLPLQLHLIPTKIQNSRQNSKFAPKAGPVFRRRLPVPDDVTTLVRVVAGKRRRVLRGRQLHLEVDESKPVDLERRVAQRRRTDEEQLRPELGPRREGRKCGRFRNSGLQRASAVRRQCVAASSATHCKFVSLQRQYNCCSH